MACSGRGDSILFHDASCDVACVSSRRAAEAKRYAVGLHFTHLPEANMRAAKMPINHMYIKHAIRAVLLVSVACLAACGQTEDKPLAEQEGMSHLGQDKGWVRSSSIWRNPVIPVCWETSLPDQQRERTWVQDAVEASWDANSRVDFTGWGLCEPHTSNSRGIRIAIVDSGALTDGLGDVISGVKNGMHLNFRYSSWNSWCAKDEALRESCIRANAVHEFGHALSFAHEHNRHDRPDTCKAERQGSEGDRILTPWDPNSIMNYCNSRRMRNGGVLSPGDISSVQQVYGVDPPTSQ
jgi:hypothetical protein